MKKDDDYRFIIDNPPGQIDQVEKELLFQKYAELYIEDVLGATLTELCERAYMKAGGDNPQAKDNVIRRIATNLVAAHLGEYQFNEIEDIVKAVYGTRPSRRAARIWEARAIQTAHTIAAREFELQTRSK